MAVAHVPVVGDVYVERTLETEGHHRLVRHPDTAAARCVHGSCTRRGTRRRADGCALAAAGDRADDRAEQRTAADVLAALSLSTPPRDVSIRSAAALTP